MNRTGTCSPAPQKGVSLLPPPSPPPPISILSSTPSFSSSLSSFSHLLSWPLLSPRTFPSFSRLLPVSLSSPSVTLRCFRRELQNLHPCPSINLGKKKKIEGMFYIFYHYMSFLSQAVSTVQRHPGMAFKVFSQNPLTPCTQHSRDSL